MGLLITLCHTTPDPTSVLRGTQLLPASPKSHQLVLLLSAHFGGTGLLRRCKGKTDKPLPRSCAPQFCHNPSYLSALIHKDRPQ